LSRLVTAVELAEQLGLKPATVLDQWEAGKLPGYKIGRAVRFDPDEILRLTRKEARPLVMARTEEWAAVMLDRAEQPLDLFDYTRRRRDGPDPSWPAASR
jgi:excisionase family DNA binding protein